MDRKGQVAGVRHGADDGCRAPSPASMQEAELAALRARLHAVEAALGLPTGPGTSDPPVQPLLRRVAALERRAGAVPGLAPLPDPPARWSAPPVDPPAQPSRAAALASVGQALVAAVLLAGLALWLTRPWPTPPWPPLAAVPTPSAAAVIAAPASVLPAGTDTPPPAPSDCPLAIAGPCLGQWTSPPAGAPDAAVDPGAPAPHIPSPAVDVPGR